MCYSAEAWQAYDLYVSEFGADIDMKEFVKIYLQRQQAIKWKIPKGMDMAFLNPKTPDEQLIYHCIQEYNAGVIQSSEQELFKQTKRVADAERKLAVKETQKALTDQRVGNKTIKQMKRWITDAKRTTLEPERDNRIWPDWYSSVLIVENGKKIVRPMRFHCRPAGMDKSIDRTKDGKVSGTYNARRDNLKRFWRGQYGHTHGLILAEQFYEQVKGETGKYEEVKFNPRTGETMYIACLWSHWTDPDGIEPDLYSFAAITDDPEPEVAPIHDRTIINIKPEFADAWLNPDPKNLAAMDAILDDKRHPYYEWQLAA